MHTNLNPTLKAWEDVLVTLRRTSVCWRGKPLSERDLHTYTEAIVLCALHLTDLSSQFGGIGSHREIVAWTRNLVTLDISDVGSFLSDAVVLLRHVSTTTSYSWFKRQLAVKYPFVGIFLAPARSVFSDFLENPNPRGFYVAYQFLSFLTHLTLLDIDVDLEREYEDMESYLRTIHYSPSMLDEMNLIMREWLKDFSIDEMSFFPSHGPGAVAELPRNIPQIQKYLCLGTDSLIEYVFRRYLGVSATSFFPLPPNRWERKSKIVFVPKSMKTRRTISKEPATLMYLQQGVWRALVDHIHDSAYLSDHIRFDKQELNAQLAIESSASHRYSTIDLSSASDTVTLTLVKAVFRGTPLYPYLVALRSRTAELPSGKVIELEKYAPMGSALCFPVETLIFSCAVEYTVRRAQRTHLGYYPKWRVYGDDIIVQDPLFEDTLLTLGGLGFITNHSKSFDSRARFRESCGGEGYDGYDVTPMKISRRFYSVRGRLTSRHAAIYEGLIDMANTAYIYQFTLLRAWIIRVLLDNQIGPPLFSGSTDCAIYSPNPDNYRARHRFNSRKGKLQHMWLSEVEVIVSSAPVKNAQESEALRRAWLYEWLRIANDPKGPRQHDVFMPEHRIKVPRGSVVSKLKKDWVRLY